MQQWPLIQTVMIPNKVVANVYRKWRFSMSQFYCLHSFSHPNMFDCPQAVSHPACLTTHVLNDVATCRAISTHFTLSQLIENTFTARHKHLVSKDQQVPDWWNDWRRKKVRKHIHCINHMCQLWFTVMLWPEHVWLLVQLIGDDTSHSNRRMNDIIVLYDSWSCCGNISISGPYRTVCAGTVNHLI